MPKKSLTNGVKNQINRAVNAYCQKRPEYDNLVKHVVMDFTNTQEFYNLIHSVKSRTKDPNHLRHKLERMARTANESGKKFNISEKNIFSKIDDLAGVRFIHLYTKEMVVTQSGFKNPSNLVL